MKNNLPKNRNGETLYPVCSWERNQHKLYNAHDIIMIEIYDAEDNKLSSEEIDKLWERKEEIEHAMNMFDSNVLNGVVYATYKDSLIIKDIVWAYNARH